MHPLALLAVGMYGETLPNQNGAPLRLVVPWKYGFKSIKSIVKIKLVEKQPPTTWNIANAARIRLLFERESGSGPSALEPGHRTPAGRIQPAQDPDVQRLRRPGGRASTPAWTCARITRSAWDSRSCNGCLLHPPHEIPLGEARRSSSRRLIPLALLGLERAYSGTLGANPVEFITHYTGDWTLRFCLITLTVTPLRNPAQPAATDPLPPHAGPVRVLLRDPALGDLGLARQGVRSCAKCGKTS